MPRVLITVAIISRSRYQKWIKKEAYCILKCAVFIPGFGGRVAGGAQKTKLNKKRKYNYNGVVGKNITMSSVYIITSKYHRKPAKGLQLTTKHISNQTQRAKKSSYHHLLKICRLELGSSAPRSFRSFYHIHCSQYSLFATISVQNFSCIWCTSH